MLLKRNSFPATILVIIALSGCTSKGAASDPVTRAQRVTEMTETSKPAPEPVYGPPQVIYRIDKNRYFTLEEYTSCDNGKTFYNNNSKNVHVQISPASGYLFKGRLFWLSTRDDYLAFPMTRNDNKAACMGSDKGCLNIIAVTTDGGKTMRSVTYGSNTQDPNGDTRNYDMLVTNNGFYLIEYWDGNRVSTNGSVDKWTFDPDEESTKLNGYPGVTGPEYQKEFNMDVSHVMQEEMQCNRTLGPRQ